MQTHFTGTINRSKFKTPSAHHPRSKHPHSNASSTLTSRVTRKADGEEGIEMKDFSTSLRRREGGGRELTTLDCSIDENESRACNRLRTGSEKTGVPILELDAMSPVTKNSMQISSENPRHLQTHMLARTPPSVVKLQSPVLKKFKDCVDENRTLATCTDEASSIIARSPLRRSVRVAKRRSVGQQRAQAAAGSGYPFSPLLLKDGSSFPVPSLLSPVSKSN